MNICETNLAFPNGVSSSSSVPLPVLLDGSLRRQAQSASTESVLTSLRANESYFAMHYIRTSPVRQQHVKLYPHEYTINPMATSCGKDTAASGGRNDAPLNSYSACTLFTRICGQDHTSHVLLCSPFITPEGFAFVRGGEQQ